MYDIVGMGGKEHLGEKMRILTKQRNVCFTTIKTKQKYS